MESLRQWMLDLGSGGGPGLGTVLLMAIGLSILLGLVWLWVVVRLIRRATVDRDPETLAAVQALPLPLALGIDAIDLGLDFLGAPVAWLAVTEAARRLEAPELKRLRGLTLLESLIPGTQLIPVMTITWIYAQNVAAQERLAGEWDASPTIDGAGRVVERTPDALPGDAVREGRR